PDGAVSNSQAFSVSPVLLTVTPSAVLAGSRDITITAKGIGFTTRVVLVLNIAGQPGAQEIVLPTTLGDPGTLTAVIPASALSAAKSGTIQASDQKFGLGSLPVPFDVRDPLSIASATPNTLDAGGPAFVMTVNGTGFVSGLSVTWAGQPIGTTFVSPTQLQAAITQQTRSLSGTFNLRVANPPGVPSNEYPVTVSPVLFGISPAAAAAGGSAVAITATGAGFTRNSSLLLVGAGQQTALATTYVNVTTLTAVVPASALRFAGAATVQVVDSTGPGHSLAQPFAITEAVPSIAGISPSSATAGAAAFALTVNGGNFVAGATVQWNGSALATTFRNATQLSAAVPAALVQAAGLSGIGVSNPGGTQSANLTFTVNPPAPVIASLSPSSASTGAAGFSMTVNGANFVAGATVQWNGVPLATSFVNTGRLVAPVPANFLTAELSAAVSVANPGGAVSNSMTFTINPPPPAISAVSPASATAGGAPFTLTVTGLNFAVNSVLRWNSTPLATTFVSVTQVTGAVTADAIAVAGAASVTLINPSGLVSNPATLTVAAPVPAISVIVPDSAQAGSPGLTIAINGTNFLTNSAVLWNGSPLGTTRVNATQLTAPVPANLLASAGAASVKVATPGAADSNAAAFTIAPAPLTAPPPATTSAAIVNAASGMPSIAPGSLISIYGVNLAARTDSAAGVPLPNLLSGTSVTIDGTAAPLIFVSPLQLNVQVPFESKGGTATLTVQAGSLKGTPVTFKVVAAAPGVFTMANGNHAIAQNNPDLTLNSADSPA
ncbi:MAG TPA: IPT/TIG domain-containing protein, partial [Candidatus Solibacter sp.]|nr:IPT/TIG domain-containing protein [Candidatus Solibacter sp.]